MSMSPQEIKVLRELLAKATPGPWTIDMRDWRGRPAQDLYISGDEYANEAGELCRVGIAIVTCPETGSVVGHANASLIAAAPDVLAALDSAPSIRLGESFEDFADRYKRWHRQSRMPAISKATGAPS